MFEKVLVANRGEIAIRIARALREMGIASVAVYSELDRDALHVERADEAYLLGGPTAAESYLNVERILEVCRESGAEAVHPGYGFLAENAPFAQACEDAGITFIGPPASAIEAMGSKTRARELMKAAGVPIVPGTTEPVDDVEDARRIIAEDIGFPVAVKAAGGGGGKGFRVALEESELEAAFEGAAREGEKFFSDATVYLERYLPDPRHVEVQVLADRHGNVIHLGERDCSVQRRHQKVIEESPAPAVDDAMRERIGKIGVEAARAVDYVGAGTIEGLLQDGEYFFLEMNTRVQVEHCVTEMVTGIDIVREGILAAAGEELSVAQEDVVLRGHAIECRINAEDASKKFAPAPGRITSYREPAGPGVRVDSGVRRRAARSRRCTTRWWPSSSSGTSTASRPRARMVRALGEYEIERPEDPDPVPHRAAADRAVGQRRDVPRPARGQGLAQDARVPKAEKPAERRGGAETVEQAYTVEVSGRRFDVKVIGPPFAGGGQRRGAGGRRGPRSPSAASASHSGGGAGADELALAAAGQHVEGARRAGPDRRGGPAHLHHRGDEDGERDHRPQGRRDRDALRQGGRADPVRRADRGHQERRLIAIRA